MGTYIIRRILLVIPTLLVVYTITFFIMHATPGGPWDSAGDKPLPAAAKRNLELKYHTSDPLYKQYVYYLNNLVHGDLGVSYAQQNRTVTDIVKQFFPISAKLGLVAILMATFGGISLGIISAIKQNSIIDYGSMFLATIGISTPSYVFATLLIWLLSLRFGLVPTNGWGGLLDKRIIIPALALALLPTAIFARYTRASVLGVLNQDFVRTARAKGLRARAVLLRHVLRNALVPVATIGGVQFVFIITGSFFVETVCNIPGIGNYFVRSATGRDYPLLMALTLLFAALITIVNLIVDILYAWLDPRISYK